MRFGVVGYPVFHSRSPAMHSAGFASLGIEATYEFLEIPADGFASIVSQLEDGTLDGVNVTMPHKGHAYAAAAVVDETVQRLGAANTLVIIEGALTGFNTDINGVGYALERLGLPGSTPIHVLGSGGAAAAAIVAVGGTRVVSISTRQRQRATDLRSRLDVDAAIYTWGDTPAGSIIVNATPLGMHGEDLPPGSIDASVGLVDMAYGRSETPAVKEARMVGIPYADGLVMLAGQATSAFRIFTGEAVDVAVMEAAARLR